MLCCPNSSYITTSFVKYAGNQNSSGEYVSSIYIIHFLLSWLIQHFPWNLSWWIIQTVSLILMAGLTEYVFNKEPNHNVYIQLDHSLHLDEMFEHELWWTGTVWLQSQLSAYCSTVRFVIVFCGLFRVLSVFVCVVVPKSPLTALSNAKLQIFKHFGSSKVENRQHD